MIGPLLRDTPTLHVVVPVHNEEPELVDSIRTLTTFLGNHLADLAWKVIIAENASTDRTLPLAESIAASDPNVRVLHLPQRGRGRAVRRAWTEQPADVVAYMDLDLSTDLRHFPPLVHAVLNGHDVAIGTRNLPASIVRGRTLLRTLTSKGYIFLIRLMFPVHFSDAQCGFKAVTRQAAQMLLPGVEDDDWFFDTELLIRAEAAGLSIYEEPVTWTDNPGSTVRVWKTITGDLRGLWRLYRER